MPCWKRSSGKMNTWTSAQTAADCFAKRKRAQEKVLLGEVPDGVESSTPKPGELEEHSEAVCLPSMRERVHSHQGIRPSEKVLQPCLCQSRPGGGKESE